LPQGREYCAVGSPPRRVPSYTSSFQSSRVLKLVRLERQFPALHLCLRIRLRLRTHTNCLPIPLRLRSTCVLGSEKKLFLTYLTYHPIRSYTYVHIYTYTSGSNYGTERHWGLSICDQQATDTARRDSALAVPPELGFQTSPLEEGMPE
jgi:hypothetical protein